MQVEAHLEQHLKVFLLGKEQEMEPHLQTLGALTPASSNARCAAVDHILLKRIDHCGENVSAFASRGITIESHRRHLSE